MGRIRDLYGEIAASADEGPEGLVLPPDARDRLRADWEDDDIEDALGLVNDSLMQAELVESADSLSARLVEILGDYGDEAAFRKVREGGPSLDVDRLGQIARRVARMEGILEVYRDSAPPDRRGFDALRRRLIDVGIEDDMGASDEQPYVGEAGGDGDEEDENEKR